MNETSNLLFDLALILIVAGIVTVIFKALKQPVVLGYIVAGVITGPYVSFIPTAQDISSVEFWGNIGVIFLLFCLGLEFSFKKLKKVGGPGAMSAASEVIIMFSIGYLVGKAFGWDFKTCIFLGAMLPISSTSIIVKVFDDMKIGSKKSSQLAIGSLIFDDMAAILILVVLPTFVISTTFNGTELLSKMFYISVFLLLWFTGGIYFIPTIFRKLKKYLTDETLIVVALGLCFVMVVVTTKAGISEALGAFVMGSILSGTIQRDKIVALTKPIKDFFGAIFFVSVGMLVDPAVLVQYWLPTLIITLALILFKPMAATIGYLFSGQTLKVAIPAGICMCQIGEFSYIIASLGKELKATPDYLYPVIVAVSILTTFITPYWIKLGDNKIYNFIYTHSGSAWKRVIEKLGTGKKTYNQQSDWSILLKRYVTKMIVITTWLVFVSIFFTSVVNPFIAKLMGDWGTTRIANIIMFAITITFMAPFIWALLRKKDKDGLYDKIWADSKFSRGPLLFIVAIKYVIASIAVGFVASLYITSEVGFVLIIIAGVIITVYMSSQMKVYYSRIETNFLNNLDTEGGHRFVFPSDMANEMHTDKCEVGANSYLAGRTIGQVHREKDTGAIVIQLIRGEQVINLPHKDEMIFPADTVMLLGSDSQLKAFMQLADNDFSIPVTTAQEDMVQDISEESIEMELFQIAVRADSPLIGHRANITSVRDNFGILIIGVEKADDDEFMRPTSAVEIEEGDTVWVVGNKDKIAKIY